MREEGENWNAYYAMTGTMQGAIPLGSIRMGVIILNPKLKNDFLQLMRAAVGDIIEKKVGVRPIWDEPISAPESERG
jgi:hypothetical protein